MKVDRLQDAFCTVYVRNHVMQSPSILEAGVMCVQYYLRDTLVGVEEL